MSALERFIKRVGKDFIKFSNQCSRLFGLLKKESRQSLLLQHYISQQSQETNNKPARDTTGYQNRVSENWSKAQQRIENLLREMTEQYNSEEVFLDSSEYLDISAESDCYKMPNKNCTVRKQKDRMSNVTSLKRTSSALDVKELKDVAEFARNLQKRNRQGVRS